MRRALSDLILISRSEAGAGTARFCFISTAVTPAPRPKRKRRHLRQSAKTLSCSARMSFPGAGVSSETITSAASAAMNAGSSS